MRFSLNNQTERADQNYRVCPAGAWRSSARPVGDIQRPAISTSFVSRLHERCVRRALDSSRMSSLQVPSARSVMRRFGVLGERRLHRADTSTRFHHHLIGLDRANNEVAHMRSFLRHDRLRTVRRHEYGAIAGRRGYHAGQPRRRIPFRPRIVATQPCTTSIDASPGAARTVPIRGERPDVAAAMSGTAEPRISQ
jgi:hypothetical protein